MKKIITSLCLVFCLSLSLSAQNGIVILTEQYTQAAPYTSVVHVFWANGTVTTTTIPHGQSNIVSHDKALNAIINDITSKGYKLNTSGSSYFDVDIWSTGSYIARRLFFAQT